MRSENRCGRVCVTGVGLVTPLGCGTELVWRRLIEGRSGVSAITSFDVADLPARIAGQVRVGTEPGECDATKVVAVKDLARMSRFIQFALVAAAEAIEDSSWRPSEDRDRDRTGVLVGSAIGGLSAIESASETLREKGPRKMSPFSVPASLVNLASGHVAMRWGLTGPNYAVSSACATGAHAIGDAARMIACGRADVMVCGGAEGCINRLVLAGFAAGRALSTRFNDAPAQACRPWDRRRDGLVISEGAGILVLEELDHARRRGAKIYGEILGYAATADAHHAMAPSPDGRGARESMRGALRDAGVRPEDIDYINAHGTSTPLGDEIELLAVQHLFGDHPRVAMSSTKSSTGHLFGAAGSVEAIFCLLAIAKGIVPPTINLDEPEPRCDMNLVAHEAQKRRVRYALSNSFGFGGVNASLVFGPPP